MTKKNNDEYLAVQKIADIFGVTRATVYNWTDRGLKFKMESGHGLKPVKRIHPDDVQDFIEDYNATDPEVDFEGDAIDRAYDAKKN